jgi:hypothetical protein
LNKLLLDDSDLGNSKQYFLAICAAQLARDSGWNAYKTVFNIYDKLPDECRPKTQKEKDNMWMVTFSKVVKRNFCPLGVQ